MKYFMIILMALLCVSLSLHLVAQSPIGVSNPALLESVERVTLKAPKTAIKKAKAKVLKSDAAAPLKFAVPLKSNLSIDKRGTWESLEGDRLVWRLRVRSPKAYSINLAFRDLYLPPSAAMFLYTPTGKNVIGPITETDHKSHQQWWSPIIPGDEVVIEVQLNAHEKDALSLSIQQVNHDFLGFGAALSDECNLDVICGAEQGFELIDRFRDIIKSVGMYSINGMELCSGSLINTTRNDCTPYFLTAYHCGVSPNNAASVVVYWNYENSFCRLPNTAASGRVGDGQKLQFNSGATYIAGYQTTDFNLLLLDDNVDPNYEPFFAGWDREGEVFDTTLCIHHPQAEEKRISFNFDPSIPRTENVLMRVDNWEIGTTEVGSSGSPLFNTRGLIIGQLQGGAASCDNIDGFDDYGMIKFSWEGGRTPDTRLKDWLDPDGSGLLQVEGRFCTNALTTRPSDLSVCRGTQQIYPVDINVLAGYDEGAEVRIVNLPEGINADLSTSRIAPDQPITMQVDISGVSTNIEEEITIEVTDNDLVERVTIPVQVNVGLPSVTDLISPRDGTCDLNFRVPLEWSATGNHYDLQIATDPNFENIIRNETELRTNAIDISDLPSNSQLFWRVRANNLCGVGQFAEPYQFTTGSIACQNYVPNDLPQEISTARNVQVTSGIIIEEDLPILDINVRDITGTHTFISDLRFELIAPDRNVVLLQASMCGDDEDFHISFDDDASVQTINCPVTDGQNYQPLQPLSALLSNSSRGLWELRVTDAVSLDGGALESWTLELCVQAPGGNARTILVNNAETIDICNTSNTVSQFNLELGDGFNSPVSVDIIDPVTESLLLSLPEVDFESSAIALDDNQINTLGLSSKENIRILVQDGACSVETDVQVRSIAPVSEFAQLILPADGAQQVVRNPYFQWQTGSGTGMVQFAIYDREGEVVHDTILSGRTDYQLPISLDSLSIYTWEVRNLTDCINDEDVAPYTFTTGAITPTRDLSESDWKLYPNPAFDKITLHRGQGSTTSSVAVELWNLSGQQVFSTQFQADVKTIDMTPFASGLYMLRLTDGEDVWIQKVVLNR